MRIWSIDIGRYAIFPWSLIWIIPLGGLLVSVVAARSEEALGRIAGNIPIKVDKSQSFAFNIWLIPHNQAYNGPVDIFMDNNPKVQYELPIFTLNIGERQEVRAKILRSSSVLAVIAAFSDNCESLYTTVYADFSAQLKANINEPIESGSQKSFYVIFTDKDGTAVPLDVNTKLLLRTSKLQLYDETNKRWAKSVEMVLPFGATSSPAIEILSDTWVADAGVVTVELRSMLNFPVYSSNLSIALLPPWYAPLSMAIMRGVLYSISQLLEEFSRRKETMFQFFLTKALPGILPGLLAGALAYLLASWGILGIKVDTTSFKGFVILGFLFSYVGVGLVLKAVTQRKDAA